MGYKLLIEKRVRKFLKELKKEKKKYIQLAEKIWDLAEDPYPQDVKKIKGLKETFLRVDVGEFRIIYQVKEKNKTVLIILIAERNDGLIYQIFNRIK